LNHSSLPLIRFRLAQFASHLVVALIALVVVGGATRVMEAGLACPDWPLCYGSFLPGRQMNLQVFLEWFHRLDAFLVGVALLIQFILALAFKSKLPNWLIWSYGILLFLVAFQGALGALTVLQLLPSSIVTAHLAVGLALIALMSIISQRLLQVKKSPAPVWWSFMGFSSLFLVITQALLGGRMATTWASKKCLIQGYGCQILDFHRALAIPITLFVLSFVAIAVFKGGWPRSQWPFFVGVVFLLGLQIFLGFSSVQFGLTAPLLTVCHQLVGALLVGTLASLSVRRPDCLEEIVAEKVQKSLLEVCHG
tara:strand:- start:234 stop:1160 length:927 start_codon:yes stop_codon:yes gene_type:complete